MKRKKSKKSTSANQQKKIVFRNFEETPNKFTSKIDPINLEEQKERFLHHGITPQFQFKTDPENIMGISNSVKGQIRFEHLTEATRILEKVRIKFGCGDRFVEEAYGKSIGCEHASAVVAKYMRDNGAEGMLSVSWSKDLSCSGRISWYGPCTRFNKPEARKYSLWLKNAVDNAFLRERGIKCLADHEIGTHFFRTLNDGLQPWYSDRHRFGLRGQKSQTLLETEEGLAAINTTLQANNKLLFSPALTYYTACKATEMSFQELYDHLEVYIQDCNLRWKYVMRVKRGIQDTNDVGGYGKDQCYFSGAVNILRNIDKIDFTLLYSGKVCIDELPRVKRLARLDCLKLPHFMRDQEEYRKKLHHVAAVNNLLPKTAVKKSVRSKGGARRHSSHHTVSSSKRSGKSSKGSRGSDVGAITKDTTTSHVQSLFINSDDECDPISISRDYMGASSSVTAARRNPAVVDYSYSPSVATASHMDSIWIPLVDQFSTRASGGADDIQSVVSLNSQSNKPSYVMDDSHLAVGQSVAHAKSHSNNHQSSSSTEYRRSNLRSPSQSASAYTWQSTRTPSPSPAPFALQEDLGLGGHESPIPYSPARWLRRRKKTVPNVLARKHDSKEEELRPISISKF